MDTKDLKVVISGDTSSLSTAFSKVRDDSVKTQSSLGNVSSSVNTLGDTANKRSKDVENFTKAFVFGNVIFSLTTDAAIRLKDTFSDAADEAKNMQASMAQINDLLITTHSASGQTAESIDKMADSIAKTTPISKNAALSGIQMLLPFTNIGKQIFPQVMQAADDLATHLNHGLAPSADQVSSAAKVLGRAFNDPATGLSLLKRAGVDLTAQQVDQIKQMQKTGDTVGAQTLLLQDLSNTMGGSAVAAGETFSGKMTMIKNSMVDLEAKGITAVETGLNNLAKLWDTHSSDIQGIIDKLSKYLTPSFEALWQVLVTKVLPALQNLWNNVILPLIPVLGGALVGAIWGAVNALDAFFQIITPIINFLAANPGVIYTFGAAFIALKGYMMFNDVFNALTIGFNTLKFVTIPSVEASVEGLYGVIGAGAVMGTIAVAGALADIALVMEAVNEVIGAVKSMDNQVSSQAADYDSESSAISQDIAAYKAGKITQAQLTKLELAADPLKRAIGGPVNSNTPYLVGENGPELYVPNQNGQIMNADKTTSLLSGNKGNQGSSISINMNVGMYAGMPVEKRQIALDLYKELVRAARSQGVSMPMIGAVGVQ